MNPPIPHRIIELLEKQRPFCKAALGIRSAFSDCNPQYPGDPGTFPQHKQWLLLRTRREGVTLPDY